MRIWLVVVVTFAVCCCCREGVTSAEDINFLADVQPVLTAHCVKCHGVEKQKGGLRLDQKTAAFRGGDSGERSVIPGHAAESRLIHLITSKDDAERMPPEGEPLKPAEIDLIRRWIDAGAEWPESGVPAAAARAEMVVTDEDRQHWSFRPLQPVALPEIADTAWVRTPVDRFILEAQHAKGLIPAPPAEAVTLIRRLYFGVIGLPPELQTEGGLLRELRLGLEIDSAALLRDPAVMANLVDALLASPHYGERWARHWLDVARYADSDGQESDHDRPNAFRFRDMVIRSLNEDRPYNTFVQWQLAGDEIAPEIPDAIAATGFLVAGNSTMLGVPMEEEKLRNRANELDDMVSTTAQALLGLTLACARCHDHKYDPLPTRDYYRMMCAFNGGDRKDVPLVPPDVVRTHQESTNVWQQELKSVEKTRDEWLKAAREPIAAKVFRSKVQKLEISEDEKQLLMEKPDDPASKKLADRFKKQLKIEDNEYVAELTADEQSRWKELETAVRNVNERKPAALPMAFAFADFAAEPRETWLFERGDFMARNQKLNLGFLTVLTSDKSPEQYWSVARETKRRDDSTQQRRAMAGWITDTEYGAGVLLARVIVNRVWQHHFGEGLVRTVSDFGTRGERPTHPELLEWLTDEFIAHDWSIKHLHRLMLNSATFQQDAGFDSRKHTIDPENRLLWRSAPRRLESEVLRDAMLAVAGTLNLEMYGPSVRPPIAGEAMQARNVKDPYPRDLQETPSARRRSVYLFHKRVVQYPLMLAFDAPDAQVSCGRRMNTTVAPQALALLNDPFVRLRSQELAERLRTEAGDDQTAQIQLGFRLGLARQPAATELADTQAFLESQATARKDRDPKLSPESAQQLALTDFCQMLFALNEFIYVE